VNAAPYRHIGGAILTDHGPVPLGRARALACFYGREARFNALNGAFQAAQTCRRRAEILSDAAREADAWRRAAGWRRPGDADRRLAEVGD